MKTLIVTEDTAYSGIFSVLFNDVIVSGDAMLQSAYFCEKNKLKRALVGLLYKNSVNKFLKNKLDCLVRPSYCLENWLLENKGEHCVIIFTNASLQKVYTYELLERLKEEYENTYYVLLLVDSSFQAQAKNAISLCKTKIFDLVYTYDEDDSTTFGFIHWPTPYSRVYGIEPEIIKEGIYFCGSDKGRLDILDSIAETLNKGDITYCFDVYGKDQKAKNIDVRNDRIKDYKDVLRETLKYSTILDVCQKNNLNDSCGLSLRVYEALVYGRVLITNNPKIKDFQFYNGKYMHYFSDPQEIMSSWIYTIPDNEYQGELSPLFLIRDIQERIKTLNEIV